MRDADGGIKGRCGRPSTDAAARDLDVTNIVWHLPNAASEPEGDPDCPSPFAKRAAESVESLAAAIMEYEVAYNTSVSGAQKDAVRARFQQLVCAVKGPRLLSLIHLIRAIRQELVKRGYLELREGPFVFWCSRCQDAEMTEFCQHPGCNLGYCQWCASKKLYECSRCHRKPFCSQHACECAATRIDLASSSGK